MDAPKYRDIMADVMLPPVEEKMPPNWLYQQDNDSKHKSHLMMGNPHANAKSWFRENNVDLLDWPSQSPDLNPTEHLWHELEQKLGNRDFRGQPAAMWTALQEVWTKISPDYISKLIDSMPNRCEAVSKSRGFPTKY